MAWYSTENIASIKHADRMGKFHDALIAECDKGIANEKRAVEMLRSIKAKILKGPYAR